MDENNKVIAVETAAAPGIGTGGSVDGETVQQIVEDYLQAHPPVWEEEDPTVPEWAKAPEKPAYTAEEVGAQPKGNYLKDSELADAICTALEQAKESGDFKGDPGEDYVLTDADKQIIAELAVQLVDIPTDAHIQELIQTALGVIENGTY